MKAVQRLSALAIATGLAGCAVGPDYRRPATTMPAAYAALAANTPAATTRPVDITQWWSSLNDPVLDELVRRAIEDNPDIEIALTRLREARAVKAALIGTSLPTMDASGAAGWGTGTNSTKGRIAAPLNAASNTTGLKEITEVVGVDAGWDLDLFGRYRREIEAAGDDIQGAAEARNAVLIAVVSDVAAAYVDARALQLRLAIIRDNLRIEQQTSDLVRTRFNRGLTNELDVALAGRQLATVESQVAPLTAALAAARQRMAVLLGQFPEALDAQLQPPMELPRVPDRIDPGLPVDLLRNRPDIREAERRLAAATARVGVATANLFPRVGITAGVGLQGQGLGRTPQTNSLIWSVGPTAYWPLLDFGTLDALIEVADLRTHELLIAYKRTVLAAVEEVDNAIANYGAEQEQLRSLADAMVASRRAADLASQRYDRGLTDFLNVLDAQRQMYELQDQYASAQEAGVLQFIALYKALGGGWENHQGIPADHRVMPAVIAAVQRSISDMQKK